MANASDLKVQCKNIFKNTNSIRESLNDIWADIINNIENDYTAKCNICLQSHAHQNLIKDEMR